MIRRVLVVAATIIFALLASASAFAGEHGGGHDPVTVCHKPGTPAQHTLTFDDDGYEAHLAHGDTLGPCEELPPVDLCPEEGVQTELPCEEVPPPVVDVCPDLEGVQTEGPCEVIPPIPPVPVTPPTHDCVFVGADKDGGVDAYGGTNDDCAPFPTPPPVTVAPPVVTTTPVTPLPTVVTTVKPTVKPKVVKKTKPVKAKVVKKVVKKVKKVTPKPDKPVVCKKGFRYTKKYGCTAAVQGSG